MLSAQATARKMLEPNLYHNGMRFLESIFGVFSRRLNSSTAAPKPLTPAFRNRVLLLCRDVIGPTGYIAEFWEQVHQKLEYLHGTPVLSPGGGARSQSEDLLQFLASCDSDHFLDFVEYIFQVGAFWRVHSKTELVDQINSFFGIDDLPYFLTDYVEVEGREEFQGRETTVIKVSSYPRVVLKEHDLVHAEAVAPALLLLTAPSFSSANAEFLDALQDYRKSDFGDCLTKCGSSFESVMKVICDRNKWPYKPTDTASVLLDTILPRTSLEPFFAQPLMLIATLRNRLSKSHGAGTATKAVPAHVAQFAINSTAAAILLLVAEALPGQKP